MSSDCKLKIRTPAFKLELEGSARFVRSSYTAVRREILQNSEGILRGQVAPNPKANTLPDRVLDWESENSRLAKQRPRGNANHLIWVYTCGSLYNKVHVIQRSTLLDSVLERHIHFGRLARIYLGKDEAGSLAQLIPLGKTLWSELTALGRQRLRQE